MTKTFVSDIPGQSYTANPGLKPVKLPPLPVKAPFVRTPYNYDTMAASDESALFCDPTTEEGRSKTQQQFTQECDVNFILDRFSKGGDINLNNRTPHYGDFTDAPKSYHEALIFIKDTKDAFMSLDARIRAKFDNDPQKYLDFMSDPKNTEEAIALGLATRRVEESPRNTNSAVGDSSTQDPKDPSLSPLKGDSGGKKGDAPPKTS